MNDGNAAKESTSAHTFSNDIRKAMDKDVEVASCTDDRTIPGLRRTLTARHLQMIAIGGMTLKDHRVII